MPKEDHEQKLGELINTVRLKESLDESLNKKDKVEILKDHIRNQENRHFGSQGKRRYQSDWNPGLVSDWEKVTQEKLGYQFQLYPLEISMSKMQPQI